MPIAYDPHQPFSALFTSHIWRTVRSPMYWGTLLIFALMQLVVMFFMSEESARQIDSIVTYPATVLGTLFAFLIGFFTNNCYTRFMDNWRACMIGWSRLNDLALQVYAYVRDRTQACEVIRLMHAANHLCYGNLSGQDLLDVCVRRHLLTQREASTLRGHGHMSAFYLTSCWALEILADQEKEQPVERMFVLAMDKSIVEWRQQTTLLPMIQMNPLPFPYYRNMVLFLVMFQLVIGFKLSLQEKAPEGRWTSLEACTVDSVLFASIALLCQSLFRTSIMLLMPWGKDDNDGFTVNLPAEYFLLLPLVGHRRLFGEFAKLEGKTPHSIFLQRFAAVDSKMTEEFAHTDSSRMMEVLKAAFRDLTNDAPLSSFGAEIPQPLHPSSENTCATHYTLIDTPAESGLHGGLRF